jgi:hypothetical protein
LRKSYKPKQITIWEPHPGSQKDFLKCPYHEVLLHGSRGGGKTDVLIMDFLQGVGVGYGEDWRGILFREEYVQLTDVINKSLKWISQIFPKATYNGSEHKWTFPDGEVLYLRYIRVPSDYWGYHGHEYPWIGFEELTNWKNDECYKLMMSCNRSSNPNVPRKIRATCNPSGFGHCVPYGEVLTTDRGWVDIRDILVGDSIFSVDSSRKLVKSRVSQVHSELYSGDLHTVEKTGIHLATTPQHKMPKLGGVVGNRDSEFTLLPVQDMPNCAQIVRTATWEGTKLDTMFTVPQSVTDLRKSRCSQPTTIPMELYIRLLGWLLAEGGTNPQDHSFRIAKSAAYPEQLVEIEGLLRECGFTFNKGSTGFTVYSREWYEHFAQFGMYTSKYIPELVKNANPEVLESLLFCMMRGDGSWKKGNKAKLHGTYWTTSQRLADDVSEIAIKLGYIVRVTSRKRAHQRYLCYEVSIRKTSNGCSNIRTGNYRYNCVGNTASDVVKTPFTGQVYCIGVPEHHTFMLRQNGSVWVSGNSWVKARFIDKAPNKKPYKDPITGKVRCHITSSLSENTTLLTADPDYKNTLLMAVQDDPMKYKAWIEGSWDIVDGGFFADLWDPKIHVLPRFPIPRSWDVVRSFDWGSSKPWAVTYIAECNGEQPQPEYGVPYLPKGSAICIMEIYGWNGTANEGDRATSQQIAERVLSVDSAIAREYGCRVRIGPADTAIWEVRDGTSIAKNMSDHGLWWTKAYKGSGSRVSGWSLIRTMLGAAKRGDLEHPHLYFSEAAPHHVRTIPIMQHDPKKPEDINSDLEDHALDSTRYNLARKLNKLQRRAVKS